MTPDSSIPPMERKKRVGTACDFCRQRKLGCDNARPKCENCRCSGKSCVYSERAKKIRPTNGQIRRLEEENSELRSSLSRLRSRLSQVEQSLVVSGDGSVEQSVHKRSFLQSSGSIHSAGRQEPACYSTGDREVGFHGPSSAMFDELHQQATKSSAPSVSVDPAKKYELLGTCIKQRQMEPIDLAAGRLDFDGVDPEIGMHLLSLFWNRQHASGLVVYRPSFMRDMACNGPYFSKILLNAIFFSASRHSPRTEFRCSGVVTEEPVAISPFRIRVEELLSFATSGLPMRMKSHITTIQALLIMSEALFVWCDERSLSWLYSGLAINMIIDLGMHTEGQTLAMDKARSTEDVEIRRRLFWAAFVQDKIQSIYQGRPPRLREQDANVPISFMDDYEELEQFTSLSYAREEIVTSFPTRSISVFEQQCKLSMIMDRILSSIYAENSSKCTYQLLSTARSLHQDLEDWKNALPEHLSMKLDSSNTPPLTPHALSLMSMYYALIILLHRPFVSDGHMNATSPPVIRDSFAACAAAASGIDTVLRVYLQRFCITTVPCFMSFATYVSGTIHVRIAAQSGRHSEAYKSLENCLDVLSQQQSACRAPRRARRILLGLARRLNFEIYEPSTFMTSIGNGRMNSSTNLDTSTLETPQDDFDMMMSGLDIDAIIQSFEFDQLGVRSQMDSSSFVGSRSDTSHDADDFSRWMVQDPLFGYDSLFSLDDNTSIY